MAPPGFERRTSEGVRQLHLTTEGNEGAESELFRFSVLCGSILPSSVLLATRYSLLALVAVLWLLAALMLRKKGKLLSLPPLFWIVAGIPAAFLVGLLALAVIAWATSVG